VGFIKLFTGKRRGWRISHRLPQTDDQAVFRNVLIADSGKGHVEEMVRTLRAIPPCRQARINLLHVMNEQGAEDLRSHRAKVDSLMAAAITRMGLEASDVNTIVRDGDTKQTVLKVAEELDADLIVMGSRGLGRLQSILGNSAPHGPFAVEVCDLDHFGIHIDDGHDPARQAARIHQVFGLGWQDHDLGGRAVNRGGKGLTNAHKHADLG
jgi:nucleotide-binding universal stress UspA family protein